MFTVTSVTDRGDDVLEAVGLDNDGVEHRATGWVSATTNYYPPGSYTSDGELVDGAKPRAMTADEIGAYALGLLEETYAPAPTLAPAPIAFTAPAS